MYDVRANQQLSISLLAGRSNVERDDPNPFALADGTNRTAVLNVGWRSLLGSHLVVNQRVFLVAHDFLNRNQTDALTGRGADGALAYRVDNTRTLFGHVAEAGVQVQHVRGSRQGPRWAGTAGQDGGLLGESADRFEGSSWERSGYAHLRWTATPHLTIAPGLRVTDSTLLRRPAIDRWVQGE